MQPYLRTRIIPVHVTGYMACRILGGGCGDGTRWDEIGMRYGTGMEECLSVLRQERGRYCLVDEMR